MIDPTTTLAALRPPGATPPAGEVTTREAFDDFVAGTFYRELLKGLESAAGSNPYFGGGRAEATFRAQLHGELADSLASAGGGSLTGALYEAFANQTGLDPGRGAGDDPGREPDAGPRG